MKAIILAAGLGSRISELTSNIPKSMIKISDKFIFEIIIDRLIEIGFDNIIITVGYKSELLINSIEKIYNNNNSIKIEYIKNEEYATTNTMYSLWLAREKLKCPFLFLHGDLIFSKKMLKTFIESNNLNSILVDKGFPIDWNDAMKVISHNGKLKYMSKQITINEMDGKLLEFINSIQMDQKISSRLYQN